MPGFTCCVPGCYNNSHRDRELRFYTFPKDSTQREIWLKNISRAGVSGCFSTFQPTTGHRVCSVHFVGGRKTYNIRVPTLFPLRGVNERKSRRGRGRGKKVSAVPGPVPTGIIITSVVSEADVEAAVEAATGTTAAVNATAGTEVCVVQIDQNGEYVGTIQTNPPAPSSTSPVRTRYSATAVASSATDQLVEISIREPPAAAVDLEYLISNPLEHSYSLTTGTTSTELLRKLNEQRDIIALMEVKMKEMKATIRQLRVTEAKLQEELRERDRLLSGMPGPGAAFTTVNLNVRKNI